MLPKLQPGSLQEQQQQQQQQQQHQYSMDSYRAYGVAKGTVLTAWRLLRCNPWGPSGYDPTAWPPVGLAWLFRVEGSAEVAVVVGLAAFVRLSHALLFE
ncbi:hypothetical protein OEZ85_005623 [Tetradesmus obliquus]|uniref:Membrane protein insertion efficiency factor YidD n=1 Tax=Tetradesmus obliquus TaxID=3088 RepID=A0ABY8UHQ3_TETOB|nr:hypothetical protein OEZ85_005623 [Tetradesmus obliquus]